MKAKITKGKGFRGTLNYVFEKENAEYISGNMAGSTPRELSAEFGVVRKLRPDIERPVWHCSLSLPAGERLSNERWEQITEDFLKRMDFNEFHPWVAVKHSDTQHEHLHIVVSRIDAIGGVWSDRWDVYRAIEATQQIERDYGLQITTGLSEGIAKRANKRAKNVMPEPEIQKQKEKREFDLEL